MTRTMWALIGVGVLGSSSLAWAGCAMCEAKADAAPATQPAAATQPSAKAAEYVCPMGDGGRSDKPGKCPKCGMDLEKKG